VDVELNNSKMDEEEEGGRKNGEGRGRKNCCLGGGAIIAFVLTSQVASRSKLVINTP
jgi:hypothetical protein